jgi:putative salt-induced outer membrane protein YdiY
LDLRLRTSVGLGREFINNERRKWSLEAGVGYRREYWLEYDLVEERDAKEASEDALQARLTQFLTEIDGLTGLALIEATFRYMRDAKNLQFDNDTTTEDSVNMHLSSHYEQQVFTRSLFSSDLTWEPDIDDPSNYRALSDLAFLTPLSEKMSLKIRLNSEYDSDPGDGDAENWQHKFLTGLEYKF